MGSFQYFPLRIFSLPVFASFFVTFFLIVNSCLVHFEFFRGRTSLPYFPVTMGPHMGSTQHFVSMSFLGVIFLISGFSIFLMGLPPARVIELMLSYFDNNLAHQRTERNQRQSENGIR